MLTQSPSIYQDQEVISSMAACLEDMQLAFVQSHETDKRRKYQAICELRRESFHPFVASTDGMLAPEATKLLQHPAETLADKQQRPYSAIMKHLWLCIAITLVKAVHHCLRGSRKKHNHTTSKTHTPPSPPLNPALSFGCSMVKHPR
jgi:hypothetical protein